MISDVSSLSATRITRRWTGPINIVFQSAIRNTFSCSKNRNSCFNRRLGFGSCVPTVDRERLPPQGRSPHLAPGSQKRVFCCNRRFGFPDLAVDSVLPRRLRAMLRIVHWNNPLESGCGQELRYKVQSFHLYAGSLS